MGQSPKTKTDRVGITEQAIDDVVDVAYQPNRPEPLEPKPDRERFVGRVEYRKVSIRRGSSKLVALIMRDVETDERFRVSRGGEISRFEPNRDREVSIGYSARVGDRVEA